MPHKVNFLCDLKFPKVPLCLQFLTPPLKNRLATKLGSRPVQLFTRWASQMAHGAQKMIFVCKLRWKMERKFKLTAAESSS